MGLDARKKKVGCRKEEMEPWASKLSYMLEQFTGNSLGYWRVKIVEPMYDSDLGDNI
jgi:hypothetical protein